VDTRHFDDTFRTPNERRINVVDDNTGEVVFSGAPIDLLYMFLGPEKLRRIYTPNPEPGSIRISLPHGICSGFGGEFEIAVMKRWYLSNYAHENVQPFLPPRQLQVAFSIYRSFEAWGFGKDRINEAFGLERVIYNLVNTQDLFLDDMRKAWRIIPVGNQHRTSMISRLAETINAYNAGVRDSISDNQAPQADCVLKEWIYEDFDFAQHLAAALGRPVRDSNIRPMPYISLLMLDPSINAIWVESSPVILRLPSRTRANGKQLDRVNIEVFEVFPTQSHSYNQ
jgi:hypothetical protein